MFRIKICGITTIDDALLVARAGADAIGLNFYSQSPRYLDRPNALRICEALPTGVIKVGLFVNAPESQICQTFDDLRLDLIQLHGDEPPELLAELGGRPVMRAFRVGPEGLGPVAEYLQRCRRLDNVPQRVLVDSRVKGAYGGTGMVADWGIVADYPIHDWHPPLILAGGLTPANVRQAVRRVRPWAVDVSSGVEDAPGIKNTDSMKTFISEAKSEY